MDAGLEGFEACVRKSLDCPQETAEMWMLKLVLVRAQKEESRAEEEASVVLESHGVLS